MNPFTVLLLRPDFVADNFGHDTYLGWVVAEGPVPAIIAAQTQALIADGFSTDPGNENWVDHTTYHPLLVCRGHQEDLSAEYTNSAD